MDELFDHIRVGRHFIHYVYPPRLMPDVNGFEVDLKSMIPIKLEECLNRCQALNRKLEFELRLIMNTTHPGSNEELFYSSIAFFDYSERHVIQHWINYWLSLWYQVTDSLLPERLVKSTGQLNREEIEQAKRTPIESLFPKTLRKAGTRYIGLCPFHQEKHPSFNIYTDSNTFHCFGCQASGDTLSFVMRLINLGFVEAVRSLL